MLSVTGGPVLDVHNINNGALGEVNITWKSDGMKMKGIHTVSISFDVEYEKDEKPVLGITNKESIKLGSSGTFEWTVYDVTSEFRRRAQKYQDEHIDELFDMQVVQLDPNSKTGRQSVTFYDCNMDSLNIAHLDIDSTDLQVDIEGTFSRYHIDDQYTAIPGLF